MGFEGFWDDGLELRSSIIPKTLKALLGSDEINITTQKVRIREADKALFWGDVDFITIAKRSQESVYGPRKLRFRSVALS